MDQSILPDDKDKVVDIGGDKNKDGDQDGSKLPQTATNIFKMIGLGGLLFMIGTGIMLYRRKRAGSIS